MGRPKQFDRETVLRRAYEILPGSQGYGATPVHELLKEMGLNRGSLYAEFSDKRSLFLAALGQYRQDVVARRLEAMRAAASPREGLRGFFQALLTHSRGAGEIPGCLVTNSAAELGLRDSTVHAEIAAGMRKLELAFAETLRRGIALGQFRPEYRVADTSRLMLTLAQGLNVMSKVNLDPGELGSAVNAALACIEI